MFIPFKFLRAHKEVHIANGHIWVFVANYLWFYIDAIFYCLDNEIVNANAFLDSKTVEHRDSRGYIQLLAICSYSSNGEKSKFILPASFIEIHKVPH